jgi:hypothetical protein
MCTPHPTPCRTLLGAEPSVINDASTLCRIPLLVPHSGTWVAGLPPLPPPLSPRDPPISPFTSVNATTSPNPAKATKLLPASILP